MEEDKIVEFIKEGVIVTIPKQKVYKNVYVEKKDHKETKDYPSKDEKKFKPLKVVINIAFFVLEENKKKYIMDLNPPAKLRIHYDKKVKEDAKGKKKKLAWWDDDHKVKDWVDMGSENTSSKSRDWLGYGDVEIPGWPDDPPIAWGT